MKFFLKVFGIFLAVVFVLSAIGLLISFGLQFLIETFREYVSMTQVAAVFGLGFVVYIVLMIRSGMTSKKSTANFLSVVKEIRPSFEKEFESYFKLNTDNQQPSELFSTFMIEKNQAMNIDWRGEENEGEIQEFIESLSQSKIAWTNTGDLRSKNQDTRDGKFIIKLFKSIDKDLQGVDLRLLFIKTDGDEYVFTVADPGTHKNVLTKLPKQFYDAGKLR